ncbi:nucleoid-associated protein YgaU [Arthrobacter sp. CAN_A214]|uniref:LysM peptidoglycan-binding domain-containing protein n=1 Tax=Arthrobacter sp. CAN_A214 TaxID=2787720 RepID=UPI0018CADEA3
MKAVSVDTACGAAGLMVGTLLWWSGTRLAGSASPDPAAGIEEILGIGCSVAGLGIITWWMFAAAAAVMAQLLATSGHRDAASIAARFSPAFMRRLAAAALGVNLLAVPALANAAPLFESASTLQRWETVHSGGSTSGSPTGNEAAEADASAGDESAGPDVTPSWKPLPFPSGGGLVLRTDTARSPDSMAGGAGEVIVKPGDSLWTIAAAHLGAFATDLEVAGAWPSWYVANREVIGGNPSLLFPGQILRIPPTP